MKEYEKIHGAILTKMIHSVDSGIKIRKFNENDTNAYVLQESTGIYIKYSNKRISPWRFSFTKENQDLIFSMNLTLENMFLILNCGPDGIVTLQWHELKKVLDYVHDKVEWISVKRGNKKMYSVAGSDGELHYKASKTDFPNKIINNF